MEMATYGYGVPGAVPFTGYTNTLGSGPANADAVAGQVYFNGLSQGDDRIAKMLRNGGGTLSLRRVMTTLLGAVAGTTATQTKKQVQHVTGAPGGVVPIETINLVNRATTAADITAFNALFFRTHYPATYAPDLSGNGGGGKLTQASGGAY
jgi:hypothetical protein